MARIGIGKILMTVTLTILIWIWADLSLEETYTLTQKVEVAIGNMPDPAIWASIVRPGSGISTSILLDSVVLKGPAARIQRVRPQFEEDTANLIRVLITQAHLRLDHLGEQSLDLLDLLRSDPRFRDLGLSVQDCSPAVVVVRLERLERRQVRVICQDPNHMRIDGLVAEPDRVECYAPSGWAPDRLVAYVTLNAEQIRAVKTAPLTARPFISLPTGQQRFADQTVTIKASSPADLLRSYTIKDIRVGILVSQAILERYQIEIRNPQDLYGLIEIRATEEARQAFEDERTTRYQVILQVDTDTTEVQEKDLIINLPQRFVRAGQIEVARPPARIQFQLIPRRQAPGS